MLLFFLKKIEVLFFYFFFISPETGSVGSVLRNITLVWPYDITIWKNNIYSVTYFNYTLPEITKPMRAN